MSAAGAMWEEEPAQETGGEHPRLLTSAPPPAPQGMPRPTPPPPAGTQRTSPRRASWGGRLDFGGQTTPQPTPGTRWGEIPTAAQRQPKAQSRAVGLGNPPRRRLPSRGGGGARGWEEAPQARTPAAPASATPTTPEAGALLPPPAPSQPRVGQAPRRRSPEDEQLHGGARGGLDPDEDGTPGGTASGEAPQTGARPQVVGGESAPRTALPTPGARAAWGGRARRAQGS